eukprot:SAG31_NODE_2161_length_6297_cov_1.823169_7_plen_478_part_00
MVIDQKKICKMYARGWLFLDLLSCFPVTYIELMIGVDPADSSGNANKTARLLRLMRLTKLLRLARFKRLLFRLEQEYSFFATGGRIVRILCSILLTAHSVACAWHWVGTLGSQTLGQDIDGNDVIEESWVQQRYGGIVYHGCGKLWENTTAGTWQPEEHCSLEAPLLVKYLDSLYYSVTTLTTVGFGDRVPYTDAEKVVSILCELAGSVIFGIIAGSLSAIAMSETMTRREIKMRSDMLSEFMRTKNVPQQMRLEISSQLANYFDKKSALDEADIIACLPPKHQRELVMSIYKPYLSNCPLVQGLDDSILSRLCMAMRPYLALSGDAICTEGELGEEMYLITRGSVRLESKLYPLYATRVWEDGAFFGELPVLDCGGLDEHEKPILHLYTARALIDSHCSYITRADLDHINAKRPRLKSTMTKVRSYFLVFVPTIREIRDFYRDMQRTNRESITMCQSLHCSGRNGLGSKLSRRCGT